MLTKKCSLVIMSFLLLIGSNVYAVDSDFILDEGNQSYLTSFANINARNYLNQYISRYTKNMNNLFDRWADSFALTGTNMPPLGKPNLNSTAGISIGGGFYNKDNYDIGLRTVDEGIGSILDCTFSYTFSSDKISRKFAEGLWKNTDITVMFNNLSIIGFEDVRMHLSNIGAVVRKQVVQEKPLIRRLVTLQGVSLSLGTFYSRFAGREDDIGHHFCQYSTNPEDQEIVVVDQKSGGTVTITSPSTPEDDYKGLVHYPYLDFVSFSFHSEIKGYMNLFHFVDLFSGVGIAFIPYNKMYSDISSDVTVRISDNQGLDEKYNGKITTIGTGKGDLFMAKFINGIVFNFGPVTIPIQVSSNLKEKNNSVATGIFISL
ncbi:hypothetical protein ACFL5B_01235 [Candidatus Latescibacterota bacterium]